MAGKQMDSLQFILPLRKRTHNVSSCKFYERNRISLDSNRRAGAAGVCGAAVVEELADAERLCPDGLGGLCYAPIGLRP